MRKIRLFLSALPIVFLWSCSATINYVGKTYPATESLDVYYSKEDVSKTYETMGHAEAVVPYTNISSAEIQQYQKELEEKARKSGADGIIIEGFETIGGASGSGGVVSSDVSKIIKAVFIKYK